MISKDTEAEILRLYHGERWRIGTIASQLAIHHTTVQRVLKESGVETQVITPRPSMADPYLTFIVEQLDKYPGLCASRLHAMVKERGYPGGPDHFRRIVGRHRPRKPAEAFQRLKTLPGEQAQVDWGHFGKVKVGRAERVLWAFVMVLSWSRQLFLRFFLGSSMPFFLRGHVDAMSSFGGVPRVLLYDNLKSAVLERRGDAVRFNPMLVELAAHYRFEPRPVAVARGNEKGRVERVIRYIRDAFFAARQWKDVDDLNHQAEDFAKGLAAGRPWPEDRSRTVAEVFEQERDTLMKLPDNAFPCDEQADVAVGKTPYARFDRNDYSVPYDHVRRTLTVIASLDTVRVVDGAEVVATHRRSWDCGQQIELAEHIEALTEHKKRSKRHRGFDRLAKSAPSSESFFRAVAQRGGNLGSHTSRMLRLLDTYGAAELEDALVEAIEREAFHIGALQQILDRRRSERGLPPPVNPPARPPHAAGPSVRPHRLDSYDLTRKEQSNDD